MDDAIAAEVVYAVDTGEKLVNQTMPAGDMNRIVTGKYEKQKVQIRNGRANLSQFDINQNGFVLADHPTHMKDFFDAEELKSIYYPEVQRLVMDKTGASRIEIFDHTLRSGNEETRKEKHVREPVRAAHNDYTEVSGPRRVREIMPEECEALLSKRFAIVQVWRAIRNPIEADPLTMCDARTFEMDDFLTAERRYPDRVGETYRMTYNPAHQWYYFPKMHRDEALVFKVYDSDTSFPGRFTPHTSFVDPSIPFDAAARESIEVRAFVFFDD
jgi:hypothetical protein